MRSRSQLRTSCAVDQTSAAAAMKVEAETTAVNLSAAHVTLAAAQSARSAKSTCDHDQRSTNARSIARRTSTRSAGRQQSALRKSVAAGPGAAARASRRA